MLLDINNSWIIQYGYVQNVAIDEKVYFPISFSYFARIVFTYVTIKESYLAYQLAEVFNEYFTPYTHTISGKLTSTTCMYIAIGH